MKIVWHLILTSVLIITSCTNNTLGLYVDELDSGVKHISQSTIKLSDNNKFELTHSFTSLEFTIPSTDIEEVEGSFKQEKDTLILFPVSIKRSYLRYGKNPDSLHMDTNGARRSELVVTDTIYGQIQLIIEPKPIIFNYTSRQNSRYIWNDESCFIKYLNSESSNDLINYCSEIKS